MIGLDTNVLLRLLLNDHPPQVTRARALLTELREEGEPAYIPVGVVLETVWVVRRQNRVPKPEVVAFLRDLTSAPDFVVGDRDIVARATTAWAIGRGDFAEYLFREQALAAGATALATFDGAVAGEDGFRIP